MRIEPRCPSLTRSWGLAIALAPPAALARRRNSAAACGSSWTVVVSPGPGSPPANAAGTSRLRAASGRVVGGDELHLQQDLTPAGHSAVLSQEMLHALETRRSTPHDQAPGPLVGVHLARRRRTVHRIIRAEDLRIRQRAGLRRR